MLTNVLGSVCVLPQQFHRIQTQTTKGNDFTAIRWYNCWCWWMVAKNTRSFQKVGTGDGLNCLIACEVHTHTHCTRSHLKNSNGDKNMYNNRFVFCVQKLKAEIGNCSCNGFVLTRIHRDDHIFRGSHHSSAYKSLENTFRKWHIRLDRIGSRLECWRGHLPSSQFAPCHPARQTLLPLSPHVWWPNRSLRGRQNVVHVVL